MEILLEPCLPRLAAVADRQPLANFLQTFRVGDPSKRGTWKLLSPSGTPPSRWSQPTATGQVQRTQWQAFSKFSQARRRSFLV